MEDGMFLFLATLKEEIFKEEIFAIEGFLINFAELLFCEFCGINFCDWKVLILLFRNLVQYFTDQTKKGTIEIRRLLQT